MHTQYQGYDGRFFVAIISNVSGMLILLFPFSNFKIENCHGDVSGLRSHSKACEMCTQLFHTYSRSLPKSIKVFENGNHRRSKEGLKVINKKHFLGTKRGLMESFMGHCFG